MTILLKNAIFIDWKTLSFTKNNIEIESGLNGKIKLLNTLDEINYECYSKIIDCKNKLVTKSFVIGHHHIYSALAKGMPAPKKNPTSFLEILKYIWWNLDKSLDKDMIEASALAAAMASAKAGSTFVIDHHASPNQIPGSLNIIAKAFDRVGVSHLLCYEISDRDGLNKTDEGLAETSQYLSKNQGLVGLHASFTISNDTLKQAVSVMDQYNSGIHIHVAEDKYDQDACMKEYGENIISRLNNAGALNSSKTILGHCLHLSDTERQIIKSSPAWIVENTESNLNNMVGHFNGANIGERIMFGTDGMHSDILQSAKYAFFAGVEYESIDYSKIYERFRNSNRYINENNFTGDGENNLVILNYDSATEINESNFLGHFIFGINSTHVETVISNGKVIVDNHEILNVDETEILKFTKEQANRLWQKMNK